MLDSALDQPQATFGRQLLHKTVPEQAAAYLFHLAQNHPFVDGNKRVAFAAADTFLRLNGYRLQLSDREAYRMVMKVASGKLKKDALVLEITSAVEALSE
jgi:death on curing protein